MIGSEDKIAKNYKKIWYALLLGIGVYNFFTNLIKHPILTIFIFSNMQVIKWCLEELTEEEK